MTGRGRRSHARRGPTRACRRRPRTSTSGTGSEGVAPIRGRHGRPAPRDAGRCCRSTGSRRRCRGRSAGARRGRRRSCSRPDSGRPRPGRRSPRSSARDAPARGRGRVGWCGARSGCRGMPGSPRVAPCGRTRRPCPDGSARSVARPLALRPYSAVGVSSLRVAVAPHLARYRRPVKFRWSAARATNATGHGCGEARRITAVDERRRGPSQ